MAKKASNGHMSVGEVAASVGLGNPAVITRAFYLDRLDKDKCPIVGKNRRIPKSYVAKIKEFLKEAGEI